MKNFYGPCYTLSESQEKLSVNASELKFLIEKKEIQCVVYSKLRTFLLFYIGNDKRWVGAGTCDYRGHYSLDYSFVRKLLDQQKCRIQTGSGFLLEADGIQIYDARYPYKRNLPHGILSAWEEKERTCTEIQKLRATLIPSEEVPLITHIKCFSECMSAMRDGKPGTIVFTPEYNHPRNLELNFIRNSEFTPDDLRISASEIDSFKKNSQINKIINPPKPTPSAARKNQLHTLIGTILMDRPELTTQGVWDLIETEAESDDPLFKESRILLRVDSDCIEWESQKGIEQSLKRKSFESTASKIRKHLALNHSNQLV